MRKNIISLLSCLFIVSQVIYAGNPGMMIRCGVANTIIGEGGIACGEGFTSWMGHCFALADGGACQTLPGFAEFVSLDVTDDNGMEVTICVPDCASAADCDEYDCLDAPHWDPVEQGCVCDVDYGVKPQPEIDVVCGCPTPLVSNIVLDAEIIDGTGACILPIQNCYNLGLDIVISPVICDDPDAVSDTITITIKPAGGGLFEPFVDAITIADLENCDLLDGSNELLDLVGLYDGDGDMDRFAFVADATGCIVIEFVRDPTMNTMIDFLGDMNADIEILACPRVFDPCSCRVENITHTDGTVLLWYDEMTVQGTPGSAISIQSNNIPLGFLDFTTQLPVVAGTPIGTGIMPASGTITIPFFRTAGVMTDVTIQEIVSFGGIRPDVTSTTDLMSECLLPPSTCANVVPTLGEWAIISLALLMLIIGVVSFNSSTQRFEAIKVPSDKK